ncbi:hypothetical protein, partial [Hydrogenophaga sp.]|uniref:hypothetical protein n=1 Tax=Hydrogenophaga sp. TaxID=1904254 RepID=UPI00341DB27C
LAMVHVTNRAHVHVRLGPLKFLFCHLKYLKKNKARVGLTFPARAATGSKPTACAAPKTNNLTE